MAYGPNLFSNPNLGDDTDCTENDGVVANGRFEFNALDGGNVGSQYITSMTTGAWYRYDLMVELTQGDYLEVFIPDGSVLFPESGPCTLYFQATGGSYGFLWRQHGANGPGWIDALMLREVFPSLS